ncbi:helicase associated domain (HA2) domain-containing protein [Ditylenchus destructor]|nr:helicase associated domain (HA2) domain-containing protein [Ditylenchus destructor]
MSGYSGGRRDGHRGGRPHFLKPGDDVDTSLVFEENRPTVADDDEGTGALYNNPYLSMSIQQQRQRLPIFKHKTQLIYLLEKFQTVVVVGETGSGKSTQIPQFLADAGWASDGRKICVTQPRRVAAVTLASRVADEMQCSLGSHVGYAVRFDDQFSDKTVIKYMTDGILLREFMSDPLLTGYSIVMIDEAHERSVNTDLIVGLLRKIVAVRPDLHVIISSATIDAELFRDYFELNETNDREKDTATIISVEGRAFPVEIFYTKVGVPDYVQATIEKVLNLHRSEGPGDILCFLTGQDEVERACDALRQAATSMKRDQDKLIVLPLYSGLPPREQLRVFDSTTYQTRKVVICTNIAETSVTIPGISFVIDCGFVKIRAFNEKSDLETLMVVSCSKSSADQRAGRAGRIRPGKCFRLYPEDEYIKMMNTSVPEIQRGDLAPVVLKLKALGIQNVVKFDYLSRPSSKAMIRSMHLLYALGAIDDGGRLTNPVGTQMAELPLSPMHARALISSAEFECSSEIATIIAMMQIKDYFTTPSHGKHKTEVSKRSFAVQEGDHMTMLNVYTAFTNNGKSTNWCSQHHVNYKALCRADHIREQMLAFLRRFNYKIVSCKGTIGDTAKIRRCLLTGFFPQVAYYDHTGLYVTVRGGNSFKAFKGSAIMYKKDYPKWVMFTDVMQNSIRDISEIELGWIEQIAPHYYEFSSKYGSKKLGDDDNIAEGRKANIN